MPRFCSPRRAFRTDIVIVAGLAPNDAAEDDEAVEAPESAAIATAAGASKAPGHADLLDGRARLVQRFDCAGAQLVNDVGIKGRVDD